jgi:hypothetical protein
MSIRHMPACTNTSPSHCSSRLKCENMSPISAPRPCRDCFHVLCLALLRGIEKEKIEEKQKESNAVAVRNGGRRVVERSKVRASHRRGIPYFLLLPPHVLSEGVSCNFHASSEFNFSFRFPGCPFTVQYYSDSGYAIIYTPDHPEGVIVADPMGDCLPGETKYRMHMSLTTGWLSCPTLIFHSPQVPAYRASLGMLPSCKNTVRKYRMHIFFITQGLVLCPTLSFDVFRYRSGHAAFLYIHNDAI